MLNNVIFTAIKELRWVYWIFPGVFVAGLATEIALHQMGDILPLSDAALTAFWTLFAYATQTMVLKRAIRILEREAKTATVS